MNTLRKYKHAVLLVALVWVGILESFSHRRMLGPVLSDVAVGTMLLLILLIVFHRRVTRLIACMAWATVVVVDGAHSLLPRSPEAPLQVIHHSAALLLAGFATLVILRNIFEQRVVRVDDVLGAMCGYLLAAFAWANLFMLIEIVSPGSSASGRGSAPRSTRGTGASPC